MMKHPLVTLYQEGRLFVKVFASAEELFEVVCHAFAAAGHDLNDWVVEYRIREMMVNTVGAIMMPVYGAEFMSTVERLVGDGKEIPVEYHSVKPSSYVVAVSKDMYTGLSPAAGRHALAHELGHVLDIELNNHAPGFAWDALDTLIREEAAWDYAKHLVKSPIDTTIMDACLNTYRRRAGAQTKADRDINLFTLNLELVSLKSNLYLSDFLFALAKDDPSDTQSLVEHYAYITDYMDRSKSYLKQMQS